MREREITYFPRKLETELTDHIDSGVPHKNVLLLEGARQVGKTLLVDHVLGKCTKTKIYINLELQSHLRERIDACGEFVDFQHLIEDHFDFDPDEESVLCIDEAQESATLGRFVRFMKEQWPSTSVILTGSSMVRLFRGDTRYPVGRVRRLLLQPFSFSEYLVAAGKKNLARVVTSDIESVTNSRHHTLLQHFDRFLTTGGLPAVIVADLQGDNFSVLRSQLIADYEQDFIRIFGQRDLHIVKSCLRSVANFAGGVSKNTTVVKNAGAAVNSRINEVFARLENWGVVLKSTQMSPSPEASYAYHPKRYLFDTGVLRHFRELVVPSISAVTNLDAASRTPLGGVLENQTAIALMGLTGQLSGWKKSPSGTEIDFVVKTGEELIPIECKASLKFSKRQIKGIVGYMAEYGVDTGYIVSLAPYSIHEMSNGARIINLPAYALDSLRVERGDVD